MSSAAGEGRGKQKTEFFPGEIDKEAFAPKCARKKTPRTGEPGVAVFELFRVGAPVTDRQCDAANKDLLRLHADATRYSRQVTGNVYCCRVGSFTTTLISNRKPASQVTPTAVTVG